MPKVGRRTILLGLAGAAMGVRSASAMMGGDVDISAADIAWFRSLRALWVGDEPGAPALFPPGADIHFFETASDAAYAAYADRLQPILCAFFLHAELGPGRYLFHTPLDGHADVDVRAEDIKLLQTTSWRTFAIDTARPYGEFNHFEIDMARALGLRVTRNDKGEDEIEPAAEARMDALHRKMQFVVQAYVDQARLGPGRWFIPDDGWDMFISPLCKPIPPSRVAAYKAAMARIAAHHYDEAVDLVIDKIAAKRALFTAP